MRTLARLTIFCVAGWALSVLVAWAIAIWAPARTGGAATLRPGTSLGLPARVPEGLPPPNAYVDRTGALHQVRLLFRCPESDAGAMVYVSVAGFPLPCLATLNFDLTGISDEGFITTPTWRAGIEIPTMLRPAQPNRILPLVPMPGPLLLNTLFWALTLAAADWLRRGTLRHRRRRRNQCTACGYPNSALGTCPECGTGAARASVTPGRSLREPSPRTPTPEPSDSHPTASKPSVH